MTAFLPPNVFADRAAPAGTHSSTIPRVGPPIRVIIVTEVRLFRDGLIRMLNESTFATVVGCADTIDDAVQAACHVLHDVIFVDVCTREALQLVRTVRQQASRTPIIALAVDDSDDAVLKFAEAGLAAYVPRSANLADLQATLEGVMRGEAHCSPRIAGSLLRRVANLADMRIALPDAPAVVLTARERDIMVLISFGLSNKEIAGKLLIGVSTVKNHVHHILQKLRVGDRRDAVAQLRRVAERDPAPADAPAIRS